MVHILLILYFWPLVFFADSTAADLQGQEDDFIINLLAISPSRVDKYEEDTSLYLAGEMAADLINSRPDLLQNYTLNLTRIESGCRLVSNTSFNLVEHLKPITGQLAPVGIIGPVCTESTSFISTLNRNGLMLPSIHSAGISERTSSISFAMLPSLLEFVHASLVLNMRNKWERFAVLFDESDLFYRQLVASVREKLSPEIANKILVTSVYETFIFPLDAIKQARIRVIYLLVGSDFLNKILCVAYHENLYYPVYQWVIVARSTADVKNVENLMYDGKSYSCNSTQIHMAANTSIFMHYQVYNFNTTQNTEAGLTTDEFIEMYHRSLTLNRIDPTRGSYLSSVYFDAVWAFALALNRSAEELNGQLLSKLSFEMPDYVSILTKHLLSLKFDGASGSIQFRAGFVNRSIILYALADGEMVPVEYWNDVGLQTIGNQSFHYIEDTFENFGQLVIVPPILVVTLLVFGILEIIVVAVCHILTFVYRKTPSVKASSPKIVYLVFAGCYFCCFSIILLCASEIEGVSGNVKCKLYQANACCLFAGLTLIFASLCAKTWRIYKIFVHYLDPGKMLSEEYLILFIVIVTLAQVVVMIAWVVHSPLTSMTKPYPEQRKLRIICTTKHGYLTWLGSLASYDGIFIFLAVLLALMCNQIPNKNFRTNSVVIFTYLISFDLIIGTSVYFILPRDLDIITEFVVLGIMLLLIVFLSIVLLFLQPLYPSLKAKYRFREISVQNIFFKKRKHSIVSTTSMLSNSFL